MESKNIIYTTPEQQIEKLKSQNLIISDENAAIKYLELFGYSNLIKSYRDPYVYFSNGKKIFRSGVTFNQIVSLYMLDKHLRNAVMAAMIDLEEHIKEVAADVVAKSFGVHPDDYLLYRNYRNKSKRKYRFSLAGLLDTMKKTLDTDKDPIHHYQAEHGIVPPWILFKSVYFGTIVNFIDQFKTEQQNQMLDRLYDLSSLGISYEAGRKLMMDTLSICSDYRNLAAHGGRTYNYNSRTRLRVDEIFNPNKDVQIFGFCQLLFLLDLLNYHNPFIHLSSVLDGEVNRHCNIYPQDVTYLGQILNLDIAVRNTVYTTPGSNKFHSNQHCSGIKDAQAIDLSDALAKGLIPCKRCALDIVPIV